MERESFDYRKAGVDIEAGERVVKDIKEMLRSTYRREVLTDIGGFSGLFEFPSQGYNNPVLAAATDGVGTKLKLAFMLNKHDTVGIDAVAMCVNDLIVQGAEPLFFLDYLAMGKLDNAVVKEVISGVAEGCRQAGCALLGGETAEMPGFYSPGEYDLVGFSVGIVDRDKMIEGSSAEPGDAIIGLASSGMHSNGFSLARKVLLEYKGMDLGEYVAELQVTLGEELLRPTKIYVPLVLSLLREFNIKGIANITGGGFELNLPRAFCDNLKAVIDKGSFEVPPIFSLIQREGRVEEKEMYRTFNMGIGMALIVSPKEADNIVQKVKETGWRAWKIGSIMEKEGESPVEFC